MRRSSAPRRKPINGQPPLRRRFSCLYGEGRGAKERRVARPRRTAAIALVHTQANETDQSVAAAARSSPVLQAGSGGSPSMAVP
jgi:hypothetical protein